MKHTLLFFISTFLFFQPYVSGQLPNGSIAPNWTLTDVDGNTHTLYDYLDQGKMVVLDFGETRCTPCWEYLNSGQLEAFWDLHGPDGLDDAMVFLIESAWETGMDDLLGLTPFSNGNWIEACPFPILDLPVGNNTAHDYEVTYFPTLFAVCHDHTLYEFGMVPTQEWIDFLESCNMEVEVANLETAICAGDGSVTVEPVGGFSPYTYQWDTGETIPTISGLISGAYTVSITEGNGKISSLEILVPGASEPLSLTEDTEPTLCFGSADGNIWIDVDGGIPGYVYDWNTGAITQNLVNVSSNTYAVTITDDLGCTMEQPFYVGQPDLIEVDVVATPVSCDQNDGTITLTISGGVGDYTLSSSEGSVIGNQIVGLSAGLISIEVEDENGCLWSDNVVTQYIDYPVVTVNDAVINCIQTTATISGFATGGYYEYDFQWSTVDGHIVSNPLSAEITVDAPGSYLLHVTDLTSGCETFATSSVADGVIIPNVDAGPQIPINCENLQVTLAANGDSLNLINWTTQDGSILSGSNSYQPIIDATGTYVIHVIHTITNCVNQDSVIIMDESVPAWSAFQYLTSGLTMAGMDLSTGSNLSGWNWTFGDGQSSGEQNPVHAYDSAGMYEVCLTVQNGCGSNQSCQTIEVTSIPGPITVEAIIYDVLCFGQSSGGISIVASGGSGNYQYNWPDLDSTYTFPVLNGIPAGTYQLIITDDPGNIFIGSFEVHEPDSITIETLVSHPLCQGDSNGLIIATASGGAFPSPYAWSVEPENALAAGNYVLTVTDPNGCNATKEVALIDPARLELDTYVVTDVTVEGQNDGAIALGIDGGTPPYLVTWSNGAIGDTITGLAPGAYDYTITDAHGCRIVSWIPIHVSLITNNKEVELQTQIRILPNPSSGNVIIEWEGLQAVHGLLTLLTLDGRKVSQHVLTGKEGVWDLFPEQLESGLYILLLKQDGVVFPFRLLIF